MRVRRGGKPEMHTCKICKQSSRSDYLKSGKRLKAYSVCLKCDFWLTVYGYACQGYETNEGYRLLVIDGRAYVSCPASQPGEAVGLKMDYILLDDTGQNTFTANNVWSLGEVGYYFRDLIEDNAKFANPRFTMHPYKYPAGAYR
ncbi:hypothetical protein AB0F25_30395 [Streptomyces wedmorensis]|uniref:hypothetical protein n=1 Tax=Streptomyces wedmorensis TaxID=43759 RepID=UPI003438D2D9